MAPAGLETAAGSPSVWRGRTLGELSAACSRAGANTIGSATIELPGGGRIDFRSQPASFVAACAAELGLVSTSTAPVPQRERAEDKAVSSAPTAASKRRKRRKASKLQRQEAAATAAALAASSAVGEDREPTISPSPSRDPSPRDPSPHGSELLTSQEGSASGDEDSMDPGGREEAAAAATAALGSYVQLEIPRGLPAQEVVASANPVLAGETEDEEEAAKAAHLSPGDEDRIDVGEREEVAAAATAALRSAGDGVEAGVLPERQQLRYITCGGCNIALSFPFGPDDDDFDQFITCLVCKHVNEPPASALRLCLQD